MDSNLHPAEHYPNSHIWMWVTVGVVLLGLIMTVYYLSLAKKVKSPPGGSPTVTQQTSATPTAVASVSTESGSAKGTTDSSKATPTPAKKTTISKSTAPKTVASEIKQIDVAGIKQSVNDLKTSLSALNQ